MAKKPVWTRFMIRQALDERGTNLTKLSRESGLWDSACREALSTHSNTRGQQAISRALGVPLEELFPQKYGQPKSRPDNSHNTRGAERQKSSARADREGAPA